MEKYLVFPVEEYEKRINKARTLMEQLKLDACVFSKTSNITYFSGYTSYLFSSDFRPFFFVVPQKGDCVFVIPELEKEGAIRVSWCDNARTWGWFNWCEAKDPITILVNVLCDMKLDTANIGIELGNGQRLGMTQAHFADLKSRLSKLTFKPCDQVVWPCRSIKSPLEIELLRKSGKANDLGCQAAVDAIKVDTTEKEVEISMCRGFLDGGALPSFMTITSGQERNTMANPVASFNKIKYGDYVCMDFGCTYLGYTTDVTRGVFVGEVSAKGRQLYEAVRNIQEHAAKTIKPGIPISVWKNLE
jgi:Xaa-Pro aminopeptidase